MEQDYYRVLGVREDASEEEIKRKYRILAKKYHPDANPGDMNAEKKFKEAGIAYAVLCDKEKRSAYDRQRLAGEKTGFKSKDGKGAVKNAGYRGGRPAAGFDFTDMSANFEQFFGFRPERSPKAAKREMKKEQVR